MLRYALIALCLCGLGLCLGCGSGKKDDAANNPNNLEYNKDGPPKREGVKKIE